MIARAFLSTILVCAGTATLAQTCSAQTYSANGQVGYLGEWEMKASLVKTVNNSGADYDGPVTLRHVGLCSVNGVEEKSGVVQLRVSRRSSAIEGTLAMQDDTCRIVASASSPYSGLMNCRDGQGVPIKFSIELADEKALAEKK
jgi:hypothetical protein